AEQRLPEEVWDREQDPEEDGEPRALQVVRDAQPDGVRLRSCGRCHVAHGPIVTLRGFRVQAVPVPNSIGERYKESECDEMGKLTADFLLERLAQNGVHRIYGYPGDGINAIVGALERHKDRIEFVQVRHEEMAAFMACGQAKWTGEVGVCLATSGPGAIHLLNGLYDAKLDHQPVMAIVGQRRHPSPAGGSARGARPSAQAAAAA